MFRFRHYLQYGRLDAVVDIVGASEGRPLSDIDAAFLERTFRAEPLSGRVPRHALCLPNLHGAANGRGTVV